MKNRLDSSGLVKLCSIIIRAIAKSGSDTLAAANKYTDRQFNDPSVDLRRQAAAAGAVYNADTRHFELNGLTDLTAADMRAILTFGMMAPMSYGAGSANGNFRSRMVRTNILSNSGADALRYACTLNHFCYNQELMETCVVGEERSEDFTFLASPVSLRAAFRNCTNLKRVIGTVNLDLIEPSSIGGEMFEKCSALETIHLRRLKDSLTFSSCAALSVDSIDEMVRFAANTSPITLTFHPDAYARLTDGSADAADSPSTNILGHAKPGSSNVTVDSDGNVVVVMADRDTHFHLYLDTPIMLTPGMTLTFSADVEGLPEGNDTWRFVDLASSLRMGLSNGRCVRPLKYTGATYHYITDLWLDDSSRTPADGSFKISNIKIEVGENAAPAYTVPLGKITDDESKAEARRRLLFELAAEKQITIAST